MYHVFNYDKFIKELLYYVTTYEEARKKLVKELRQQNDRGGGF